jgi:rfaE bifunctional protein kinase chain/domain
MLGMREILHCARSFRDCRVLVIGDLMIDEYVWGHIERISPEAPVPILKMVRSEATLGGAGNVVRNLRAIGVQVEVCGVVGRDDTGAEVRRLIEKLAVETTGVIADRRRRSTRKVRLMSLEHGQQVFRMDEETTQEVHGEIRDRIIAQIREAGARVDVILCSDYLKGTLTKPILQSIFEVGEKCGVTTLVAPKDSNPDKYQGAKILMLNQRELAQLQQISKDGNGWLENAATQLVKNLALEALVVTRGAQGMSLFESAVKGLLRVEIPTMAKSVYDVTGAGDTAISYFAAAIAAGADLKLAVHLANLAAGIKVAKRGTNTVTFPEIEQHLADGVDVDPINSWEGDAYAVRDSNGPRTADEGKQI